MRSARRLPTFAHLELHSPDLAPLLVTIKTASVTCGPRRTIRPGMIWRCTA